MNLHRNPTESDTIPIKVKPVENDKINYFEITNNGLVLGQQPLSKRIQFWNDFYEKYENVLGAMTIGK